VTEGGGLARLAEDFEGLSKKRNTAVAMAVMNKSNRKNKCKRRS
jgi:hypothetical protein